MDLSIISTSVKQLGRSIDRNSPTILTALGVAGVVSTVIFAVKGTIKATRIINEAGAMRIDAYEEQAGEVAYPDPLFTPEEVAKMVWREYIPTAIMGLTTITCIVSANHISLRRNAALVSLLSIAETAAREYQAKVVDQIGEKREEKIRSDIAQDHLDQNPASTKTIVFTGNGNYLCFDDFSKRYFRSDVEEIRRAVNQFNQHLLREGWLGINEFYDELGLEPIELGDEFGWIAERSILEISFNTKMAKETNEPCLVIAYTVSPAHI
jgi:hypothetical protein